VLPVYRQADHIEEIVKEYLAALDHFKHSVEILLVVNSKGDGSLECCKRIEENNDFVRVFYNEQPGWGLAVRTGLSAARGETLCYTNSARTSAHVLAVHIMLAVTNPDQMIKANRRLRHPLVRRIGSVLYNVECRNLYDLPVWDINGTPKAFSREICDRLNLQEDGDLIDLEFILRCKQLDIQIIEVPIVSEIRHGGESTTNFISAYKMYWGAYKMRRILNGNRPCDRGPERR